MQARTKKILYNTSVMIKEDKNSVLAFNQDLAGSSQDVEGFSRENTGSKISQRARGYFAGFHKDLLILYCFYISLALDRIGCFHVVCVVMMLSACD